MLDTLACVYLVENCMLYSTCSSVCTVCRAVVFTFCSWSIITRCRFAEDSKSQLQTFGKTRFSSFRILIQSLQLHHTTLDAAVRTDLYAAHARKAVERGTRGPPEEELPQQLQEAANAMEDMKTGLYNTRALSIQYVGLRKYAVIYQDVLSQRLWDALQVCSLCSC